MAEIHLVADIVIVLAVIGSVGGTFQSQFRHSFNYSCPTPYQTLSHIASDHHNKDEDRQFTLECRDAVQRTHGGSVSCEWTDIANMFDQQMTTECKGNHYINGIHARFDPSRNDRTWRIHCCAVQGVQLRDCQLSDWTNTYDQPQTYDVPPGMVLKDIMSSFEMAYKDRRFRFVSCYTDTHNTIDSHAEIIGGKDWLNIWDQPLNFECSDPHQGIARFESMHDNNAEDRQFKLGCRDVAPGAGFRNTSCHTGGAANEFHKEFYFMCPDNGYIRGMSSTHSNSQEDRIWTFQCCQTEDISMANCEMTVWKNYYDWYLWFPLPEGAVIRGVVSRFDDFYKDREYRFQICWAMNRRNTSAVAFIG